ncbi:Sodium/calcium exchanger protein-domain-containing protein [Mycena sanguinolenta]|nr:Sodium/calcium exchanger protein-domain-containing protein [Mycena sanguinolenta]
MPLASPRLIFAVVFALNCVLWSSSRYGEIPRTSFLHGGNSLVKRISYELANSNAPTWEVTEKQCRPLAFPAIEQCAHVRKHCPLPKTFLSIPYLPNYYCTETELRPLIFTGLILWLFFLFSTLGISASDFFTPNLATIAQMLGLDENVAGVTFLAFGNGSPDVFSTFSAMRADSGSLAIGELLGAASFIVSCVVGSMCIIKPFQLHRPIYFIRDVGFMLLAITLLLAILWDGHIRFWEAAMMIAFYILYVVTVVLGTWLERRQERMRVHEAMVRSEYDDSDLLPSSPLQERYRDQPSAESSRTPTLIVAPSPTRARAISAPGAPPRLLTDFPRDFTQRAHSRTPSPSSSRTPGLAHMPSFSLVGALEFRQVVASLQHEAAGTSLGIFDSPYTPYAGGHYNSLRSRSRTVSRDMSREIDPWDTALGLPLGERSRPRLVITPALSEEPNLIDGSTSDDTRRESSVPSISRTAASPTASDGDTESQNFQPLTRRQRFMQVAGRVYHRLFPSLHNFRNKTVLGQIASVFAAPAVLLLTLTLPVVVTPYQSAHLSHEKTPGEEGNLIDFEEEGIERILVAEEEVEQEMHGMTYSKWLTAAQCTFGPLFCATVLFGANKHYQLWALISAGIVGFAASVLVALFGNNGEHASFRMARCSIGFIVAIVWIMAIADEVVKVLQTFGFIFGLSDAIIGLTIFAVGNSLADLVANMSVAVFAPIMGFSACFGGPMLNILLGVGISGTYITQQTQQPYDLHFSTTLLVSTIGLLILLATTLIVVPLNGYHLTRTWGIILIVAYLTIMTINVIVEIKS